MVTIKENLAKHIRTVIVVICSSLLLFIALSTDTSQRFIEAFARHKSGIWGEPAWYACLMFACGMLMLALLINTASIALKTPSKTVYKRSGLLIMGLILLQGLFYSSVTPPWQAPDEHAHYEYAALMGELNRVPSLDDVRQDIQAEVTASMFAFDFWRLIKRQPVESPPIGFYRAGELTEYPPTHVINNRYIYYPQVGDEPPLYYVLPASLYKLSAGHDATYRLYLMRFASVFFLTSLGAAIWWASQVLFTDRPWLALAVLTMVVFSPMLNHIGTVLSNDGLVALWSTLALGTLTLIFQRGITWRRILSLSVLVVLAVLTKKSSLWLVPTVVFAFLVMPQVSYRWRLRIGLGLAGATVVVIALLLLPSDSARYWQGGAHIPDANTTDNHVLLITDGERVSQPIGRQRTFQVRGQSIIWQAYLRSDRPSQINICLEVEASATQCQTVSTSEQWQPSDVRFTVPAQADRMELVLTTTVSKQLWIDDIALTTDGENNLLRNGSMESGVSWLERLLVVVGQPLGIGNLVTGLFTNLNPQLNAVAEKLPLAWQIFFDSFWGNFGAAMVVPLTSPWPLLTRIAVALAALGWVLNIIRHNVEWQNWQKSVLKMLCLAMIFALVQTFLPLLSHRSGWMPQGRFLFPAIWAVVTLLVVGWYGWITARTERLFLLCVTLAAMALSLGGTWRLISYFHG